jgi:hypothetical protein
MSLLRNAIQLVKSDRTDAFASTLTGQCIDDVIGKLDDAIKEWSVKSSNNVG